MLDLAPKSSQSFQRTTELDIIRWFKPLNTIQVPYEDEIRDIWYNERIPFSERAQWLNNLFLITSKGYYIQVSVIVSSNGDMTDYVNMEGQPYSVFLRGAIISTFIFAYNSTPRSTLAFLLNILKSGKITITKYIRGIKIGQFHFSFCNHGYSYIPLSTK